MPQPTIHVVFGMSAAGSIRQALDQIACRERVIGLPDDLSYGPISPPSASLRQRWIEKWLGCDYEEVIHMADLFWAEATCPETLPIAWVCRHDASEYAGFLEFIWRKIDTPLWVVDVTDVEIAHRHGRPATFVASSLGELAPEQIASARLHDRRSSLRADEVESYRKVWDQLRTENVPLRVVNEKSLVSAPITYFDDVISRCATTEWQKGARVVGETIVKLIERPHSWCPSDLLLWSRVLALADAGVLECSGDRSEMRGTLVRRSQAGLHPGS